MYISVAYNTNNISYPLPNWPTRVLHARPFTNYRLLGLSQVLVGSMHKDMWFAIKELCPYIRLKIDGGHFDGLVFRARSMSTLVFY